MANELWIFGYGSLIWRVNFPFAERRPAFIRHWSRRFWQGSTDHRGVPGAPGRVVTLVESSEEVCWGMAYRIREAQAEEVFEILDFREQGGYDRLALPLQLQTGDVVPGVTYHAVPGNPNYLGPASTSQIATQINRSMGPSGSNTEYLMKLAEALNDMGAIDRHVLEIASHVSVA